MVPAPGIEPRTLGLRGIASAKGGGSEIGSSDSLQLLAVITCCHFRVSARVSIEQDGSSGMQAKPPPIHNAMLDARGWLKLRLGSR
jgi:hypothetical protein